MVKTNGRAGLPFNQFEQTWAGCMDIDALWDFDDLPASKARLEAALAAATAPQDQAIWLTQLARMAGLEGDFTQGELLLNQAEAIGPTAATAARITLERARMAREEGRSAMAATGFHQAAGQARAAGATDVALDALHMQAIAAPPAVARAIVDQAERLTREAPSQRHWLGPFYNNLGWALFEAGEIADALEMFNRDKALRRSLGAENERRVAGVNAAKMLRYLGRNAEALDQLQRLVVEIGPQGFGLGLVFEERAELAFATGKPEEARHYADEARRLFEARGMSADQHPSRFARLSHLAEPAG